jgi:hypothetical protein
VISVSVHHKGRICILDPIDFENWSLGIKPDCKDHRHVNRVKAFEISRDPRFGNLVALLASSATTADDPAPSGCFVEVGGVIEYVHLRPRTKVRLKTIHALGERIAAEKKTTFKRRAYYLVPVR